MSRPDDISFFPIFLASTSPRSTFLDVRVQASTESLVVDTTKGPSWWRELPCNRGAVDLADVIREVIEAKTPPRERHRTNKGMKYKTHRSDAIVVSGETRNPFDNRRSPWKKQK